MGGGRPIPWTEEILWQRRGARVATRVLVGGDVIPRLPSVPPDEEAWGRVASGLGPLLRGVEFSVVNLECPLTGIDAPRPKVSGTPLRADPAAIGLLEALGVRVASLANNHSHDQGPAGLRDTAALLEGRGIAALGGAARRAGAPPVGVVPLGDSARLGVYAASMDLPESAGWRQAGVEPLSVGRARRAAVRLRARGATARVALLHLGTEGVDHLHPGDVRRMRAVARAGFDVVAACHSHRPGGFEVVPAGAGGERPAVLLFGLGSLVSTALYGEREREGLVALLGLDRQGALVRVSVVPLRLEGEGRPELPDGDAARAILRRVHHLAGEVTDGSHVSAYHREASRDLWRLHGAHALRLLREQGLAGLVRKLGRLRARHLAQALAVLHPARARGGPGSRSRSTRR